MGFFNINFIIRLQKLIEGNNLNIYDMPEEIKKRVIRASGIQWDNLTLDDAILIWNWINPKNNAYIVFTDNDKIFTEQIPKYNDGKNSIDGFSLADESEDFVIDKTAVLRYIQRLAFIQNQNVFKFFQQQLYSEPKTLKSTRRNQYFIDSCTKILSTYSMRVHELCKLHHIKADWFFTMLDILTNENLTVKKLKDKKYMVSNSHPYRSAMLMTRNGLLDNKVPWGNEKKLLLSARGHLLMSKMIVQLLNNIDLS